MEVEEEGLYVNGERAFIEKTPWNEEVGLAEYSKNVAVELFVTNREEIAGHYIE